jgi:hypothetical protein
MSEGPSTPLPQTHACTQRRLGGEARIFEYRDSDLSGDDPEKRNQDDEEVV